MKYPDLYFKTTKALFDACAKETLFHGSYGCCADGQIIAAAMGYHVSSQLYKKGSVFSRWLDKTGDDVRFINEWKWGLLLQSQNIFYQAYLFLKLGSTQYKLQKKHLASTGYTPKELNLIMDAFDSCYDGKDETKNILPALKKVLQTLKKIHKVDHFDIQQIYREKFVAETKTLELLPERYKCLVKLDNMYDKPQQDRLMTRQTGSLSEAVA
jgi:hypothetical protein